MGNRNCVCGTKITLNINPKVLQLELALFVMFIDTLKVSSIAQIVFNNVQLTLKSQLIGHY